MLWEYIQSVFSFNPDSPLLFTQFQFWAFFALVFTFFALTKSRPLMRNAYLFFVSLLFYYKTSGLFVGILVFVTISDFFIAQGIYALRNNSRWKQRALLTLSILIDLGILCYFKYAYFFADFVNTLLGTHIEVTNVIAAWGNSALGHNFFSVEHIILPVGISFFTFQIISYTCDVYKGLVKPVRNILNFGFYVSFFPQLVAGPIIKASDFIPQLYRKYNLSRLQFGIAVFWIINGLLKKIILSDYLAVNFIDRVFENPHLFTGFENLSALFLYSLQVYADFSGYTDIAIGLSLLFGFYLPKNFNSPYKAPNCSNFWKRWHISLSRWLQTYLYIPLGGNRNTTFGTYFWIIFMTLAALVLCGNVWVSVGVAFIASLVVFTAMRYPERRRKIYANLNAMITMLLGGLWHGASMNFIIWGGLNGVGMVIFKFWRDMSLLVRALISTLGLELLFLLTFVVPGPLLNILLVFMLFIAVSAWVRIVYKSLRVRKFESSRVNGQYPDSRFGRVAEHAWSVLITFVFITFTRLFFRSGSNLDPAVANETAWSIATRMVKSIGTQWNADILPIISTYHNVFLLFVVGMIIHWLPSRFKLRYRIMFAKLPLPVICLCAIVAVFIVYQFVTAELQPFIYFQF
ncbi:MAG: MBOAT family protein [Bacteroidaceae bacterium]|nr:MBOAT family protein [Bacteroidaceae bacterium]